MVARAFLLVVVVGLGQWLLEHYWGAVVARAVLLAVVIGLGQWLLEHSC